MLEQLRMAYGKRVLKNAVTRPKKVQSISLESIRKCVVVIDEQAIKQKRLQNAHLILENANPALNIHFISYSKKPNDKTTTPFEKLEILYRKDLNWYYRPKNMSVGVCDLLIDLTLKPVLPLQFLTAMSNSTFKVGIDQMWNKEVLSLMIQSKEPEKLDDTIEQLVKYINMINKEKDAA